MEHKKNIQETAIAITRWVGSPASIIVHTVLFAASFLAVALGFIEFDRMLLVLTTVVSLEAIYLAIFIQMTINYQAAAIAEVEQDIDEIQEDVQEMQEDVGEIQEDVEEISEDVDELQEDVEEMSEEEESEEAAEERRKTEQRETLDSIESSIQKLMEDITYLKTTRKNGDAKPLF